MNDICPAISIRYRTRTGMPRRCRYRAGDRPANALPLARAIRSLAWAEEKKCTRHLHSILRPSLPAHRPCLPPAKTCRARTPAHCLYHATTLWLGALLWRHGWAADRRCRARCAPALRSRAAARARLKAHLRLLSSSSTAGFLPPPAFCFLPGGNMYSPAYCAPLPLPPAFRAARPVAGIGT